MIGRFYRWLFDTHRHEWETIKEKPYQIFEARFSLVRPTENGSIYVLRCKTCGDIKSRKVGP